MLGRFSHVMLYTSDMRRALRFYVELLGFELDFEDAKYSTLHHASAGLRLALHGCEPDDPDRGHGGGVWFETPDISATVAALRAVGVEVEEPRREGHSPLFCGFRDPDGNPLGLQEASTGRS